MQWCIFTYKLITFRKSLNFYLTANFSFFFIKIQIYLKSFSEQKTQQFNYLVVNMNFLVWYHTFRNFLNFHALDVWLTCKINNLYLIYHNVYFDKNPVYNKYSVIIPVLMTAIYIFTTNAIYHDIQLYLIDT